MYLIGFISSFIALMVGLIIGVYENQKKGKSKIGIIIVLCSCISLITILFVGMEENTNKQKVLNSHNKKEIEELLTKEYKISAEKIYVEEKSNHYKVTTNKGIYKVKFKYDSQEYIIGIQENIPILTIEK